MMKSKKLKLTRETVMTLATRDLQVIQGGIPVPVSAAPVRCEPSGIVACTAQA